jgi:hypothetical protein
MFAMTEDRHSGCRLTSDSNDWQGDNVKAKKTRTKGEKESSSVYFQNLRPKFLDWEPPTEEEKAREARARKEAKEAELKRVTDLAKKRDAEKGASRRR